MRENPDTSLKLLRLLADEDHYPSRLRAEEIPRQLGITGQETLLHINCCVENGLMDADVRSLGAFDGQAIVVGRIRGLTARGQESVRNADAADGKWWRKATEKCAQEGVDASTSILAEVTALLVRGALLSGG